MLKKRGCAAFAVVGWLFAFCCLTERKLALEGNIEWDPSFSVKLLLLCFLGGLLFGGLFVLGVSGLERLRRERNGKGGEGEKREKSGDRGNCGNRRGPIFLFSWLCIVLCWLPGYLAYYPGICAYDTPIQLEQITSGAYNDHHPLFHTLFLEGAMKLGELLGSVNLGIGLAVFLQMLFLAAVFAAGIMSLGRLGKKVQAVLLLYCCCFPFHWFMSVSMTKDTIFSAFFLAFLLLLCGALAENASRADGAREGICAEESVKEESVKEEVVKEEFVKEEAVKEEVVKEESVKEKPRRRNVRDVLLVISGIGIMLFRNNGVYALLALLAVLGAMVVFGKGRRKLWARLAVEVSLSLAAGFLLLHGVFAWLGAGQGDKREMLSMPIQQIARTYVYHGGVGLYPSDDDTMEERDKALINDFILDQAYLEYRPDISDPVKKHTNTYVVRYRTREFLQTYLHLLARYPGDYVNAALAVNAGYLYPWDETHYGINLNGRDKGLGYIQTRWVENELNPRGIYKDSKWEWLHEKMEEFADGNGYLKLPLLKYLMVPGTYLWFWMIVAAWLWIRRKYRWLLPLALILGYYVTLFLGPTVQLRYLYPVMIALPFTIGAAAMGGKRVDEKK